MTSPSLSAKRVKSFPVPTPSPAWNCERRKTRARVSSRSKRAKRAIYRTLHRVRRPSRRRRARVDAALDALAETLNPSVARVVRASAALARARTHRVPSLTNDDGPDLDALLAVLLHAEVLRVGIATILRRPRPLLVRALDDGATRRALAAARGRDAQSDGGDLGR
jgi:hypothetical protein